MIFNGSSTQKPIARGGQMRPESEALVASFRSWSVGPGWYARKTAERYEREVRAFARARGIESLDAVTVRDFDAYVAQLQVEDKSPATIRVVLYALKRFFRWAHEREFLARDPAKPVRLPPRDHDDEGFIGAFTSAEVTAIERAAGSVDPPVRGKREPEKFFACRVRRFAGSPERGAAAIACQYAGALRTSELANLTLDEVLRPDGRDGGLALSLLRSKARRKRTAPIELGPHASALLKRWLSVRSTLPDTEKDRRVFMLSAFALTEQFDRAVVRAGLARKYGEKPTPKWLRRSRGSHALRAGMTPIEVSKLLRHRGTGQLGAYIASASAAERRALAIASLPEAPPGLIEGVHGSARIAKIRERQRNRSIPK